MRPQAHQVLTATMANTKGKMRPSRYLNAVEIGDGNSLLYNGLSQCIDVAPSEIAQRLISPGLAEDLSFLTPTERQYLRRRGHLTSLTAASEQKEMRKRAHAAARREMELDNQGLLRRMVTFILTYGCNLACAYCYQAEVRKTAGTSSMTATFAEEFLRHHVDELRACARDDLYFQLYGGEPLLERNRAAIEAILRYAKVHGISVSTVTNAVRLPEMLDLIGPDPGKINIVQVTLDGERTLHDLQRVSRSGAPTFAQTIRAIRTLMNAGANTIIRIHIHPDRIESARAVVEYLEQEKILGNDRVKVYFWSTEDLHCQAMPPREFELFASLFQDVARRQNSPPTAHFLFLEQIMNRQDAGNWPVRNHCSTCVSGLHCVVDPLGDVYECIDDAGRRERRVGTLNAGKLSYRKRRAADAKPYLRDKPECLKCSVALYCGGGCINRLKTRDPSPAAPFCLQIKDFIRLTLRSLYVLNQNRAAQRSGRNGNLTVAALMAAIQHHLTPSLLPPRLRQRNRREPLFGHCYHSMEALYYLIRALQFPKEYRRFRPYRGVDADNIPHWWLQDDQGAILDPTVGQYTSQRLTPPYDNGKLTSFLSKGPSPNAQFLIEKITQRFRKPTSQ